MRAWVWVALMMVLGFLTANVYAFLALTLAEWRLEALLDGEARRLI